MTQPDGMSDESLVERARSGDRDAFGALVERYQDAVYRIVRRTSRVDPDAAEDLAQEAFLRAYRALDRFRGQCSFAHWLFRIATNLTINRVTTLAARADRTTASIDRPIGATEGDDATMEPADNNQVSPGARIERDEVRDVLRGALSRLSEEYRAAVVLRDVEGLDYDAISAVLEVPVGTVRSRLHRGREALREILTRIYGVPALETRADGWLS